MRSDRCHEVTSKIVITVVTQPILLKEANEGRSRFPSRGRVRLPLHTPFQASVFNTVAKDLFDGPIIGAVGYLVTGFVIVEGQKTA